MIIIKEYLIYFLPKLSQIFRLLSNFHLIVLTVLSLVISGCGSPSDPDNRSDESSSSTYSTNETIFNNGFTGNGNFLTNSGASSINRLNNSQITEATALYNQQCSECHGPNGHGGITGVSLRSCSTCGDYDALVASIFHTMPPEDPETCGLECSDLLANFILSRFPKRFEPVITTELDVDTLSAETTLQKAARNLASRPPTPTELNMVRNDGESGLLNALESVVNDQQFCSDRLMEIYNERLRTDANLEAANFILLYHKSDFPNLFWFRNAGSTRLVKRYGEHTIDAIARQPLHHIAYVACNDRPFTEILTADYMVVNPYSARALGIDNLNFDDENDPTEFKETRLSMEGREIPHAGILTTPSFLRRYPTTESNLNRGRAYRTYLYFLATDILTFNGFRPIVDTNKVENPEVNDPNCSQCHKTLDPVAQAYFNWDNGLKYGVPYLYDGADSPIHLERPNMWPAGFESTPLPEDQTPTAVRWLAKQITNDRRFARSVVITLHQGFTGELPFKQPNETDTLNDPLAENYYNQQQNFFDAMTQYFIDNNYNVKELAKAMIAYNPYFRANAFNDLKLNMTQSLDEQGIPDSMQNFGMSRLLDPAALSRKLESTFWFTWTANPSDFDTTFNKPPLDNKIGLYYGKLDNQSNRERTLQPNGIMAAIQTQMATEAGLFSAMHDFSLPKNQRKLFREIESDTVPLTQSGEPIEENIEAIQSTIHHLHHHLYGDIDAEEAAYTYDLFLTVWQQGIKLMAEDNHSEYLPKTLKSNPATREDYPNNGKFRLDEHYTIRAWGAVLSYLINDYRFLYD